MRKRLSNIVLENGAIIEIIGTIEKSLNTTVIPSLKDLEKLTADKTVLANNIAFSSLNLKKDKDLFVRLENVVNKYLDILPFLKEKVANEIPDTITTNTSNLNNKLVISLICEGVFFAEELPDMLSVMIERFYTKSGSELDKNKKIELTNRFTTLIRIIPEIEKANLKNIVDTIGEIPTINTIRSESVSDIPTDVIIGFFKTNFKIKDFYTQTFLKRMINVFSFKQESKVHKDIAKSFIGNPIYHLRLFLVDLQSLRLEKLKEDKRLLELRILELKQGDKDGKLKQQISYFEDKLNKLNMKINRLATI